MKSIKYFFVVFAVISFSICPLAQASWQEMGSPTSEQIYTIDFINQNTGFMGTENSIYKTTNRGNNWYLVYNGHLTSKQFGFSGSYGYAVCYNTITFGGEILHTTNLGETWVMIPSLTGEENGFTGMIIKSPLEVYVTVWDGMVLHTTNGFSWSDTLLNVSSFGMWDLKTHNNSFITCSSNSIYKQMPDSSWEQYYHGIDCFGGLAVTNTSAIYIVGATWSDYTPAISHSTNGGLNWTIHEIQNEESGHIRSIAFLGDQAYAVGQITGNGSYIDCIWKKIDTTWVRDSLFSQVVGGFGFFKIYTFGNDFFILGKGKIYKKVNTVTGVNNPETIIPKYSLNQNYPNPFNPVTKINYSLPKQSMVSLKVYDMAGKEVMTLAQGIKSAGKYTVDFNGANLSSGIYFYKLQTEDFVETKKMMLVK